jgi:hypothetical protein
VIIFGKVLQTLIGHTTLWILTLTAIIVGSLWHAEYSLLNDFRLRLGPQIAEKALTAELYSPRDSRVKQYIASRIATDLGNICHEQWYSPLKKCYVTVSNFNSQQMSVTQAPRQSLSFTTDKAEGFIALGIHYTVNWPYLLLSRLVIFGVAFYLIRILPPPLSPRRTKWLRRLLDEGVDKVESLKLTKPLDKVSQTQLDFLEKLVDEKRLDIPRAIALARDSRILKLSPEQQRWFWCAMERSEQNVDAAMAVGTSAPSLCFKPLTMTVCIHGIDITLAATPFLYYYWYALQRKAATADTGGWFINPPVNRADWINHQSLLALLEKYGGHGKAVNDLKTKGLRAKILDQNRSKVKEELIRVLGDELAQSYLFDTERDARTARYRYRLSLPPKLIKVDPQDHFALPASEKHPGVMQALAEPAA